jgi:hypothetical protein
MLTRAGAKQAVVVKRDGFDTREEVDVVASTPPPRRAGRCRTMAAPAVIAAMSTQVCDGGLRAQKVGDGRRRRSVTGARSRADTVRLGETVAFQKGVFSRLFGAHDLSFGISYYFPAARRASTHRAARALDTPPHCLDRKGGERDIRHRDTGAEQSVGSRIPRSGEDSDGPNRVQLL